MYSSQLCIAGTYVINIFLMDENELTLKTFFVCINSARLFLFY